MFDDIKCPHCLETGKWKSFEIGHADHIRYYELLCTTEIDIGELCGAVVKTYVDEDDGIEAFKNQRDADNIDE